MNLSILIPTVPPRKKYLNRLLTKIQTQIVNNNLQDKVEVIVFEDDFEVALGSKRNVLVSKASGKYVVVIDDDDDISDDYCYLISKVIDEHDVDQIPIGHRYFHNSKEKSIPIIVSKEYKHYCLTFFRLINSYITEYDKSKKTNLEIFLGKIPLLRVRKNSGDFKKMISILFLYTLKSFLSKGTIYTRHTIPVRKSIFESVKFTDRPREQDLEWVQEVYDNKLIKSEYKIDKDLYFYYYNENMSINRGKWGFMKREEKIKKLTEVANTIEDFEWEFQPIDKIQIKWI